jgi:hypothetical protein
MAPDILQYKAELVARIKEGLERKVGVGLEGGGLVLLRALNARHWQYVRDSTQHSTATCVRAG